MRGSARSARAALGDLGLVPVLERRDEVVRSNRVRRRFDLLLGRARSPERDVLAHRAREEETLLRDDAELAAQALLRDRAEVVAVDGDVALARVVEAREELRDRGLPRARMPHERDRRPGRDVQLDAVQNLDAPAVAEADVLEVDVPLDHGEILGVRRVQDFRLFVEHLGDLVQRRDRGEKRVVELGKLLHRIEEVGEVQHEGEQGADREVVVEIAVAAVAEHDRGRRGGQEVDEREVEAVGYDRDVVGLAVMGVDVLEVALVRGLTVERLHDSHAGDVLGKGCRDEPEPFANRPVGAGRHDAEDRRRDRHEREDRKRGECELPVQGEEDRGRTDEDQRVLEEARHAVGDELVERLDVVRQAADQHARPVALVEAEGEPLEMAEELVAQVGEDALAGPAGEIGLCAAHHPVERAGRDEDDDDFDEPPVVLGADAVIEGELREVGRRERGERRREEGDDRERRPQLVTGGEPGEGRDAVCGAPPRPVVHLGSTLHGEVGSGLPDPHAEASSRAASSRSIRPCS
jgi:hypothetical protein